MSGRRKSQINKERQEHDTEIVPTTEMNLIIFPLKERVQLVFGTIN
jgi:hypothetical protein